MEVLLLKDVNNLGFAGDVKKVSNGYARNFLFPSKSAKPANAKDIDQFRLKIKKSEFDVSIAGTRIASIAQQIKNLHLTIKKKSHDEGKLYASVNNEDIVDILKEKGIQVNKKQIEFLKNIRTTGDHKVVVKLNAKVKPELSLKVVASEE